MKILKIAHTNQTASIKAQCLQFVDIHIEELLRPATEEFLDIPFELLIYIISRDSLCLNEELLFVNINIWMSMVREQDRGNLWEEVIPHIRFGRMSMDFFLDKIVKKSILEDALALQIMRQLSKLDDPLPLQYTKMRQSITCNDIVVNRFMNCSSESTWVVDNTVDGDRISFTINLENMKLKGLVVYGKAGACSLFSVMLYSENGQTLLGKTQLKQQCPNEPSIPVIFPTPVLLLRDTVYTVVLKIMGDPTSYGLGGLSTALFVLGENTTLAVKFLEPGCGNTNVRTGQIKGLIFKHV